MSDSNDDGGIDRILAECRRQVRSLRSRIMLLSVGAGLLLGGGVGALHAVIPLQYEPPVTTVPASTTSAAACVCPTTTPTTEDDTTTAPPSTSKPTTTTTTTEPLLPPEPAFNVSADEVTVTWREGAFDNAALVLVIQRDGTDGEKDPDPIQIQKGATRQTAALPKCGVVLYRLVADKLTIGTLAVRDLPPCGTVPDTGPL